MKLLIILFVLIASGCTDSQKSMLKAEITGEKYTIKTNTGRYYKVNDYHINGDIIYFHHEGSEYNSNVWTVKTTSTED